jgi:hypothetical protein
MAFTDAQEAIILQMIEAFQNGKRLNDLPVVDDTISPFSLITHVIDKSGESKQAQLTSMLPYIEEQCAYGVEIDLSSSSPTLTRVGNSDLHRTLPLQNRMKGCLLDDDGKVVQYLPQTSWIGMTRDGSLGQVMDELPDYYSKFTLITATKYRVMLSEYPLPGYHLVKKAYMSAYEASLQRSTNKLASVVNDTTDYRGGNNTSGWDNTYRSLLGRPATNISRTNFRNYARNRKNSSTEWNANVYSTYLTLFWFFVVEYATLNSQADFNAELTSEGYHQGGLGAGVTTWNGTAWNNFNAYNPFVPCGTTDSLGNNTGTVDYSVLDANGNVLITFAVPRYRGIENPFGHIWKWTDGINIRISPTEANGGDGLSKVFTCNDPAKFTDSGYDGYTHVGNEARNEGYVKTIIGGENGDIIPTAVGGGDTSYFCDYHFTNIPTAETLRGVPFGGFAADGAGAGLAYAVSNDAPSYAHAGIGSRLCFIPE